jgi:hypothetical protein
LIFGLKILKSLWASSTTCKPHVSSLRRVYSNEISMNFPIRPNLFMNHIVLIKSPKLLDKILRHYFGRPHLHLVIIYWFLNCNLVTVSLKNIFFLKFYFAFAQLTCYIRHLTLGDNSWASSMLEVFSFDFFFLVLIFNKHGLFHINFGDFINGISRQILWEVATINCVVSLCKLFNALLINLIL